jgi:hypothetical protein
MYQPAEILESARTIRPFLPTLLDADGFGACCFASGRCWALGGYFQLDSSPPPLPTIVGCSMRLASTPIYWKLHLIYTAPCSTNLCAGHYPSILKRSANWEKLSLSTYGEDQIPIAPRLPLLKLSESRWRD